MNVRADPRTAAARVPPAAPLGMLAELTHRCPLQCAYCSNPLELERKSAELATEEWCRIFDEAAALGILHVHLSGGEPTARRDIVELVRHAGRAGLYTNLITAGLGVTPERLAAIVDAGLDHVQLSFQGADAATCDHVGGMRGSFEKKLAFAAEVKAQGVPLTVNAVVHRINIHQVRELIDLAVSLGARRVEIAHAQYYGWALKNRSALMPSRQQALDALAVVEAARKELEGVITIDAVVPDYFARLPKPCMNGWGRQFLNVTPSGKVLPCHASETIPGLEFWNVRDHGLAEIWDRSPAFEAFRGTSWMPEPCRSCERREIDWGGCRCQALAITGDAAATDPACHKSPHHERFLALGEAEGGSGVTAFAYRRYTADETAPA